MGRRECRIGDANGKTVTGDFIEKNGRTYVPIADVAKLFDMTVSKSGSGYVFRSVGGANQNEPVVICRARQTHGKRLGLPDVS